MSVHDLAAQRVLDIPASDVARGVGGWLLAEMPSSVHRVSVFPSSASGLAFEFENGPWDLTVEVARDGTMLLFGVEIDGPREIEPFPFDACSAAMMSRIARLHGANDR